MSSHPSGSTIDSVDIGASITAAGSGRVPLVMEAHASVKILFVRISVSMSFTLGYIELPKMVYLAGNPSGDARIWNPAAANGVLYLNTGSRNSIRGIGEGAGNEMYTIEHMGSDASGETLRVVFSGRETIFRGVKKLVAYGDGGDDHIYVKDGVTSDVEFHGGDGNDVFIYDGTGQATLYGDAGDDYLATGDASTTAFLFTHCGQMIFAPGTDEAKLMDAAIEAGADDVVGNEDGSIEVITPPNDFANIKDALEKAGFRPEFGEVTMKPQNETEFAGEDALKMQKLLDALESLDDVQEVYTTAVIDE